MEQVREPAVSGLFYPNTSKKLKEDIQSYLEHADPPGIKGNLIALVVPHAGYAYSGHIAAWAYRVLQNISFDTIILVGPNHQGSGFFGTSIYSEGAFKTPLGIMEVDQELAKEILADTPGAKFNEAAHSQEHSIEVQIPFLQMVSSGSKIVPIVMSDYEWSTCERLAESMVKAVRGAPGKKILLIASTDLSHYHTYDEAVKLDHTAIEAVESLNAKKIYQEGFQTEKVQMCGFGPVLSVVMAAKELGAQSVQTLQYANSGDVTEDHSRVVGYAAMALLQGNEKTNNALEEKKAEEELLTDEEKEILCGIARDSIESSFQGSVPSKPDLSSPRFNIKRSVFVTLFKDGELRGCIGTLAKDKPLKDAVKDVAYSSAFNDYRFLPVKKEEMSHITIEISILTDPVPIENISDIQLGLHGVIVRHEGRSGLFLPQVATEQGWDVQTTLTQACLKGGMEPDAWKKGAQIQVFRSIKFGEKDHQKIGS